MLLPLVRQSCGFRQTPVILLPEQDLQNISNNKIPASLRANDINGNDKYSELLSQQILNKLLDLEYINKNILK